MLNKSKRRDNFPSFQNIICTLQNFWCQQDCILLQPYDLEMAAGTSHPMTALYALGLEPWRAAFVQPCRRPGDGRYGDNPNRVQKYYQFQVILKPAPQEVQTLLKASYAALGIDLTQHDIRFVEDDWANPSLGAAGVGWEVWMDGMEVTQFTYFQQMGGMPCEVITAELTYGLERIALFLQQKNTFFDLWWNDPDSAYTRTYGDVMLAAEKQFCHWYFEESPIEEIASSFASALHQGHYLLSKNLTLPAYEQCIRANHLLNMHDARGALSAIDRASSIGQVCSLAAACCQQWLERSGIESQKEKS